MTSTINLLRLLADPTRLRLLLLLEEEELSVAELQEILGMGQSRISSHLAQLKRAGVVEDRRAGKNVYYGLTEKEERNPARAKCRRRRAIGPRCNSRSASAATKRANISTSWPGNSAAVMSRAVPGRRSRTPLSVCCRPSR